MNLYDISEQVAVPVSPRDSLLWFIQFRPVGRVPAYSASQALRIARGLRWRAPVVSAADTRNTVPPLTTAPASRGFAVRPGKKG